MSAPLGISNSSLDEKVVNAFDDSVEKELSVVSGPGEVERIVKEDGVVYVNAEPVVTTGADVSRLLVDMRDDEDPALTFRSLFLGTIFAGLGAALCEIYTFKPLQVSVSTVFLLLLIYSLGMAWAKFLPRRSWVEGTWLEILGPLAEFVNPGEFRIKEHVISSLVASTAAHGNTAVLNFAVQRLYYNTDVEAITAVLATFSTACFGYGLCGLLRPLTVYPSEMVYWTNLPTVSIFQALHFDTAANHTRMKLFWIAFIAMLVWEIIPSYIFPLLTGFSVFCLASQNASDPVKNVFTNIFGGAEANEGLGLLSLSFDWQYITSIYMSLPLVQQANSWIGLALCYVIFIAIYYSNAWNSKNFPMISTSIFSFNGSTYDQNAVFGGIFQLNQTALNEVGLPYLTGSNVWLYITNNLAVGGLIAHCICFWSPAVRDAFVQARSGTQPDPHWKAMQKYNEAPFWWYICLLVLAFAAGLVVILKGQTTLPWYSFIVALLLGSFVTPFSQLLYARLGNGIATNQLMKMAAGVIAPGRPVANLYARHLFTMWSHDIVGQSIGLAGDLKIGQYLKIPPRTMFLTQLWGTILGATINYFVMVSVVDAQRDILISPQGTNVWSGQTIQSLNSEAVTWSLAKELFGPSSRYFIIPMSLLIGMGVTFIQWLISKRWSVIGPVKVDTVMLPVIYMYSASMASGLSSSVTSCIIVGVISQFWLRKYHPGWFRKYNYIIGGAFDGGAQVMIFILSFAVFGASGKEKPFPPWAGNPAVGNVDYCNGNKALNS
ncbi:OPT oligopeptide transporter protein-domain-containing protein [Phlebopus sp. FC_14]|nr:OPT oligopeptide transporter protein-domain-containing protein [Phlebopus sp. FC_14]